MKNSQRYVARALCSVAVMLLAASAFAIDFTDYAMRIDFRVSGDYSDVLDFPVLVRLSEGSPAGFSYSVCAADGSDIGFFDTAGTVAYPYEIDTWNPSGESLVWVRLPSAAKGASFVMCYGRAGQASGSDGAAVWSDYVGVWHMGEANGTVADATGNGLNAAPAGDATAQSVATNGPVGNARVNATDGSANRLEVPYSSALDLGDTLSFSGWAKLYGTRNDGRMTIVTRKELLWGDGWNVSMLPDSSDDIGYWGKNNQNWGCLAALNVPDLLANWVHITVTYSGATGYMYINGNLWATVRQSDWTANTWQEGASDTSYPLTFGYTANGRWDDGWSRPFQGAFDEFRLFDGVLEAARVKAEYTAQTPGALLYEVNEMISGQVTLLSGTTYAVTSAAGRNTLCVTGTVASIIGASGDVFLAVGVAEPKDGDPVLRMAGIATNTVTAAGETVFTWDGAVLGTKVAFALMNVVSANGHVQTNASATTVITLQDPAEYFWKAGERGYWSDASKWTTSVDDGLPRLGYPSYGSRFQTRWGSQTAEILVDAAYEGLQGNTTIGWRNDNITFRGTVEGAAIGYPEGSGFGDGQYDNTHITLDGVALTCGSYHVWHDASLTMLNGASLTIRWEMAVEGANASLFVGDGCVIDQRGVDGNRFGFAGENASFVISNGVVKATILRIGGTGDTDTAFQGQTPKGIFFEGENPQLQIRRYAKIHANMGAELPVVFSVPRNGYTRTPIVKADATDRKFAELNGEIHGLGFAMAKDSPFFGQKDGATLSQTLVDWSYSGTAYAIETDAISFVQTGKAKFSYLPAASATKNAIIVDLKASFGTKFVFR